MRLLVGVAAVAFASPHGCCVEGVRPNTRTRDNRLLSKPVALVDLDPPDTTILVRGRDGLTRVSLDGTRVVVIDAIPSAMTTDGSIRVHVVAGRYVVRSARGEQVIADLVATRDGFRISPDERFVAVTTAIAPASDFDLGTSRLAIISLIDGTARTLPLEARSFYADVWADDSSAFFHYESSSDTWKRVDIATSAVTEARPPVQTPDPDGSVDCPAKGFRLRVDIRGGRQRIVLDPIATQANPEVLSALRPRLLVEAENLPSGKLRDDPARLGHLMLTKPCDHFMFDYGGWIYVGAVGSGRIAALIRGSDPR
jgi:hypothetical protein